MSVHGTNLVVQRHGGVLVVSFSRPDVIDLEYIREVADELHVIAESIDPPFVVIDFERVRYLSSSALGVLVSLSEKVRERNGELGVTNVSEEIYGVFELTHMPRLLRMFDSTPEAIRELKPT